MLSTQLVIVAVVLACGYGAVISVAAAPEAPPAGTEVIRLWAGQAPLALGDKKADTPTLACFPAKKSLANGAAVLVCPGGGYTHLAMSKEGYDIARWLNHNGYSAFVLKYRLKPYRAPAALLDAKRAMRTLRSREAQWHIDPNRIGVIGFSAGGHVASTLGTHFDAGDPSATDPLDRAGCRPDFMILAYPVITMSKSYVHMGSRNVILGHHPTTAKIDEYSNEKHVTSDTPPTFLVHAKTDTTVPWQNSQMMYEALIAHHVPDEFLLLPHGHHGFGLGGKDPVIDKWPGEAIAWLFKLRFDRPK